MLHKIMKSTSACKKVEEFDLVSEEKEEEEKRERNYYINTHYNK